MQGTRSSTPPYETCDNGFCLTGKLAWPRFAEYLDARPLLLYRGGVLHSSFPTVVGEQCISLDKRLKGRSIDERPVEVSTRSVIGHWEADPVVGLRNGKEASSIPSSWFAKGKNTCSLRLHFYGKSSVISVP